MLDLAVLETTPLVVSAGILTVRAIVREVFWWRALGQLKPLLRAVTHEQLPSKERRELLKLLLAAQSDTVAARAKRDALSLRRLRRTEGDVTST